MRVLVCVAGTLKHVRQEGALHPLVHFFDAGDVHQALVHVWGELRGELFQGHHVPQLISAHTYHHITRGGLKRKEKARKNVGQ